MKYEKNNKNKRMEMEKSNCFVELKHVHKIHTYTLYVCSSHMPTFTYIVHLTFAQFYISKGDGYGDGVTTSRTLTHTNYAHL